jgi:hypothetical protein
MGLSFLTERNNIIIAMRRIAFLWFDAMQKVLLVKNKPPKSHTGASKLSEVPTGDLGGG